ncbi:glycosyltransferase [Acinetobacter baumannii]|uniref:glycosyltransferase n=3 Tax=Acinetobacter baumannii TaxID=470 RepID=UPI00026E2217|nr:glycosyltransferase [Acinetobacter baumannii]EHU1275653.1 glycosyltransferase [Acinetobacter baumannii]EHU1315529.1 glycosyltransferase [Acinetobacter baumannii]EHU2054899.1 glycosyltransferase [Acinetobacter baumannii]EHU2075966.1 glycosyltransferase [Acinetobacter baumannii]EHU2148539.1 glycosyltransferase [Acinetobacter baumannii]
MKVMLFITGLGMGGAEKVVCELADKLYELGHEVCIVYFTGEIIRRPKNNINIIYIPLKISSLIFSVYSVMKLVDQWKPDVIHSHMFHANIIARLAKIRRKNIRIICSSHSNYEGGALRMMMYAMTEKLCDVHTNVSSNAATALMHAGAVRKRKIKAVYNGINIKDYHFDEVENKYLHKAFNLKNEAKTILAIGRIDTPKDYPNLLKAFKIIYEIDNSVHLFIAGNGPKKEEIMLLANNLGINSNVKFLGIRNDIPKLLNSCDLFISSSAWEGFGLAILEAMICKKPIVATETDGAKELLNNENLVEIGNPELLAKKALQKLNSNLGLIEYSGIESFDWNEISKTWLSLYEGKDF